MYTILFFHPLTFKLEEARLGERSVPKPGKQLLSHGPRAGGVGAGDDESVLAHLFTPRLALVLEVGAERTEAGLDEERDLL